MRNIENQYLSFTSEEHRKNFCQFFTEKKISDFMVNWLISGHNSCDVLFDPCFGLGTFYESSQNEGFKGKFLATEIDSVVIDFCREAGVLPEKIKNRDYLLSWGDKYDAIVCNPPYARFQNFLNRDVFFSEFHRCAGIKLSGYTNLASAFLAKSVFELSENGRLAYIMPLEFLGTGYGGVIKRMLRDNGEVHIIKIECEKEVFPSVTTSVGLVLLDKSSKKKGLVRFSCVSSVENFHIKEIRMLDRPDEKENWSKFFAADVMDLDSKSLVPILSYGSFVRGIATGANEFFVLDRRKIGSIGLAPEEYVSCIAKSEQIRKSVITQGDIESSLDNGAKMALLRIREKPSPRAADYLKFGESEGFHFRYLTRSRNPWYKTEYRSPAPILFGTFSRGNFKVVRNYSNALNLSCFHGFKANLFGTQYIDSLFLYLVSNVGRSILTQMVRKYGDKLDKFEPNDLNVSLCPSVRWFEENLRPTDVAEEMEYVLANGRISNALEEKFLGLLRSNNAEMGW